MAEIRSSVLKDVDLFQVRTKKLSLVIKRSIHDGFPDSSVGKESACNTGDPSSIPGSERSAGEGIGYPLQYSGLENSMDCIVRGLIKSWTQLNDFHFQGKTLTCHICIVD